MFGKITRQQVNHHFNRAKDFLGNAYHKSRKVLASIDSGIQTARNIYSVVAPVLDAYGVKASNNHHITKALNSYDTIRNNIVEKHDRVANDLGRVRDNLAKKKINLNF